jgi:hypothetical protein
MNTRTFFLIGFLIVGSFLAGCDSSQEPAAPPTAQVVAEANPTALPPEPTATDEPTPTPAPTDTPIPTATPTATATPTPTNTPTPTPDLTATAAVRATETALAVLQEIDSQLQEVGLSTERGQLAWVSESAEGLTIDTYNTEYWTSLAAEQIFSDFVLKADVTWESSSGFAVCGFRFRAASDDQNAAHYKFQTIRISGLPLWDVEYWKDNTWIGTMNPGSRPLETNHLNQEQGSTNTYILIAEGNLLTVYANGNRLGQLTITTLQEGQIANYAWQESGETTCTFHNAWIWDLSE